MWIDNGDCRPGISATRYVNDLTPDDRSHGIVASLMLIATGIVGERSAPFACPDVSQGTVHLQSAKQNGA
jgi:hypothetical protein